MRDEADAIDALETLGLSQYEAQVFVALQRLGVAPASEIATVADVPRSQVYGAAERLEGRGLVEVQQSSPIRYRAVDVCEARARLRERLEREQDRAFEYLDRVHRDLDDTGEEREELWTLQGRDAVVDRILDLVSEAGDRIVYGADEPYVDDAVLSALADRQDVVTVVAFSADPGAVERFEDAGLPVQPVPADQHHPDAGPARLLVVDRDAVLLSVVTETETAIWSAGSGFATVLVQLADGYLGGALQL